MAHHRPPAYTADPEDPFSSNYNRNYSSIFPPHPDRLVKPFGVDYLAKYWVVDTGEAVGVFDVYGIAKAKIHRVPGGNLVLREGWEKAVAEYRKLWERNSLHIRSARHSTPGAYDNPVVVHSNTPTPVRNTAPAVHSVPAMAGANAHAVNQHLAVTPTQHLAVTPIQHLAATPTAHTPVNTTRKHPASFLTTPTCTTPAPAPAALTPVQPNSNKDRLRALENTLNVYIEQTGPLNSSAMSTPLAVHDTVERRLDALEDIVEAILSREHQRAADRSARREERRRAKQEQQLADGRDSSPEPVPGPSTARRGGYTVQVIEDDSDDDLFSDWSDNFAADACAARE